MISYAPLWETLKKTGINKESLTTDYGISSATINRLIHDQPVKTTTINTLCLVLQCSPDDVIKLVYTEEDANEYKARKERNKNNRKRPKHQ